MHIFKDRGQYVDRREILKELEKEGPLYMKGVKGHRRGGLELLDCPTELSMVQKLHWYALLYDSPLGPLGN